MSDKCEVPGCDGAAYQRVFILDKEDEIHYLCTAHFHEFMHEAERSWKAGSNVWIKEWLQQLNVKEASK